MTFPKSPVSMGLVVSSANPFAMKRIPARFALPIVILLASCAAQPTGSPPDAPVYSVASKNADDEITLRFEDGSGLIEIASPSGIGSASFTLESGEAPRAMTLRLRLAGLEEVRLTAGEVTVSASIPSSGGLNAQSQRVLSDNGEQVLRSFDALWLDIEIVSNSPRIPLEDGYFEVVVPKEFLRTSGGSFEMQWIDFYR